MLEEKNTQIELDTAHANRSSTTKYGCKLYKMAVYVSALYRHGDRIDRPGYWKKTKTTNAERKNIGKKRSFYFKKFREIDMFIVFCCFSCFICWN